jgi:hypothetical protein
MIGMVVATGIAVTRWWWLPIGVAVFVAGTLTRTRADERLATRSRTRYSKRRPATDADGGKRQQLTFGSDESWQPLASPDGRSHTDDSKAGPGEKHSRR